MHIKLCTGYFIYSKSFSEKKKLIIKCKSDISGPCRNKINLKTQEENKKYSISGFFRGCLIFTLFETVIDQRKKESA